MILSEKVQHTLLCARTPLPNLTLAQRRALLKLKMRKDLYILPADKGDATVVINKTDYEMKVLELITDQCTKGDFQELPRDPTHATKVKIENLLREMLRDGAIQKHHAGSGPLVAGPVRACLALSKYIRLAFLYVRSSLGIPHLPTESPWRWPRSSDTMWFLRPRWLGALKGSAPRSKGSQFLKASVKSPLM